MNSRFFLPPISFMLLLMAMPVSSLFAEEPYLEFLQGLRERKYFDSALAYLDILAQKDSLPESIKPVILYEKAITLRESAKELRTPEKQFEQLDQSLAFLEQFVSKYPDHPSGADANSDRAEILLQKAQVEISQSKTSANRGNKTEFQKRGREFVQKARDVLKLAFDQHEAAFKKYPQYIDEQKEPKLRAEREKIELSMISESLSLAKCLYFEAQTYEPNSRIYKQSLNLASEEFEKVFRANSNRVGGLHARLWQGKCFEEQGEPADLSKAIGFYTEVLGQPGNEPSLKNLKSLALQFKVSCLNVKGEHQNVADYATEWLKDNPLESNSSVGVAIQWEQAKAFEALGDNKDLPKDQQVRYWQLARTGAQKINRFAGESKESSLAMMQRIQGKLGGKEQRLDSFDKANTAAHAAFDSFREISKELDAAIKAKSSPEEITRLTQTRSTYLHEAANNFELALSLVTRQDNRKVVATSRLVQAYTNYYLQRFYESAILGEHVARSTGEDEASVAMDGAYISLQSYRQIYNERKTDPGTKKDEMRLIIKAANRITDRWPLSERANEARMSLGDVYKQANQPAEAAEWYGKIPEADSKYAYAQLEAGRSYWSAYGSAFRLPVDSGPTPEKLTEWKSNAEKHLRTGIAKLSATTPADGAVSPELINGKISLVEILQYNGKDSDSADVLSNDPQSVVKAVTVPDEAQRPETGIQRRATAIHVYKLLLRAFIGMGKLDDARETMKTLEVIAEADPNSDLTELYVGLGRMLKDELERFRKNGENDRFNQLFGAFEAILGDMSKKQETLTLGALSWIGEQYSTLGEISPDRSKIASYYEKAAAAFNRILSRSQTDGNFATSDQIMNVKVRLVHSNRLKRDFEGAEKLLADVFKERGNDLRAQIEGANVYQDWGMNGDHKKFIFAISGKKDIGLWGWGGIATRIQKQNQNQKNFSDRPELVDSFLDARYNVSLCRFHYAKELAPKERMKEFEKCAMELVGSSSIMKSMPDEKRAKLNELYREVLKVSGKRVVDLPRTDDVAVAQPKVNEPQKSEQQSDGKVKAKTTPKPKTADAPRAQKSGDNTIWMIFGGVVVAGAAVVGWIFLTGKKKPIKTKTKSAVRKEPDISFAGFATEGPVPSLFPLNTSVPTLKTKPKTTSSANPTKTSVEPSSSAPLQKPASRPRPEPGTSVPPKPRPKPPFPPANE